MDVTSYSKTKEAGGNAPAPISFTAAALGREIHAESLVNVRAPKKHRVVPVITVSVSYRIEPIPDKD